MILSIQNDPWVATMKPDGKFGWKMDLLEPEAAMWKKDRAVNETLFEDRERHRIGESTYFDDLLYYSISKDTGDVRIFTLKLGKGRSRYGPRKTI